MCGIELYEQGQYDDAVELLTKEAVEGDAKSQYYLGNCYCYGRGVKENKQIGIILYRLASLNGCVNAQADLALCLLSGNGCKENAKEAFDWAFEAAKHEHGGALAILGLIAENGYVCEKNLNAAFIYYHRSAKAGNSVGNFCVGIFYFLGKGKIPQDHSVAAHYFEEAAKAGHADACYMLACMYNDGDGVPVDHEKAIMYLNLAARNGHERAKQTLDALGI